MAGWCSCFSLKYRIEFAVTNTEVGDGAEENVQGQAPCRRQYECTTRQANKAIDVLFGDRQYMSAAVARTAFNSISAPGDSR